MQCAVAGQGAPTCSHASSPASAQSGAMEGMPGMSNRQTGPLRHGPITLGASLCRGHLCSLQQDAVVQHRIHAPFSAVSSYPSLVSVRHVTGRKSSS